MPIPRNFRISFLGTEASDKPRSLPNPFLSALREHDAYKSRQQYGQQNNQKTNNRRRERKATTIVEFFNQFSVAMDIP